MVSFIDLEESFSMTFMNILEYASRILKEIPLYDEWYLSPDPSKSGAFTPDSWASVATSLARFVQHTYVNALS